MRLIECTTFDSNNGPGEITIDLDKIAAIRKSGNDWAYITFESGFGFMTDMSYKKAVEIWENYKTDKGVGTTLD